MQNSEENKRRSLDRFIALTDRISRIINVLSMGFSFYHTADHGRYCGISFKCDNFRKRRLMENLEVVAARRPREGLDVIEAVWANPATDKPRFSHAYVLRSVTDTLCAVALNPYHLGTALNILKRLTLEGKVENAFILTHKGQILYTPHQEKPVLITDRIDGAPFVPCIRIQVHRMDICQRNCTQDYAQLLSALSIAVDVVKTFRAFVEKADQGGTGANDYG